MVLAAYTAAFISSISFGLATVFEQVGAKRVHDLDTMSPRSFAALLRQMPYFAGLMLDGLGFLAFLVAVRVLPLFLVQAVGTASIAVTALGARTMLGVRLTSKEYRLMAVLIIGLGMLSYAAAPEGAAPIHDSMKLGLELAVMGVVALVVLSRKLISRYPVAAACMSGLCFSGVAIIGRVLPVGHDVVALLVNPLSFALVLYGVLGLALFSIALQNGSVTRSYAVTFVTETMIPTILGIWLLGDSARMGMWPLMIGGMAITVVSATALALAKDYAHYHSADDEETSKEAE